jgi:hypothetical protein
MKDYEYLLKKGLSSNMGKVCDHVKRHHRTHKETKEEKVLLTFQEYETRKKALHSIIDNQIKELMKSFNEG